MWKVIYLACGLLSKNCMSVTDAHGPHLSERACIARLHEIDANLRPVYRRFAHVENFQVLGRCIQLKGVMS